MVLCLISANSAFAEKYTTFGVRMGIYTSAEEIFIGGEMDTPLGRDVYFNPNLEFVLIDGGTLITFNFDFYYDIPTSASFNIWAGGGPAIVYTNPDGPRNSQTDLGINLLFGMGFPTSGTLIPYVQAKALMGEQDDFVLGFGVRF
jgi:hypothetical protein